LLIDGVSLSISNQHSSQKLQIPLSASPTRRPPRERWGHFTLGDIFSRADRLGHEQVDQPGGENRSENPDDPREAEAALS
jgi:hypothetical protein